MLVSILHKTRSLLFGACILYGTFITLAQPKLEVNWEKTNEGYTIFAVNKEVIPVSVLIKFELLNLNTKHPNGTIFVIPAKQEKYPVTSLSIASKGKYKFSYTTQYNYGDYTTVIPSDTLVWELPFAAGDKHKVHQGYKGNFSHENQFALDFTMKVGTPIHASRAGIVFKTEDAFSKGCGTKSCASFSNYIYIYHPDGSVTKYLHLKKNGVLVTVGQNVTKGQHIGYSGNTGWSTGPHLHFEAYVQQFNTAVSFPTNFNTKENPFPTQLRAKKTYTKPRL